MSVETSKNFKVNIVEYDDVVSKENVRYIEIIGYNGTEIDLEIPSEINGIIVKSIANRAFSDIKKLKSIVIANTVRDICFDAFSGCENLESVVVPKSVMYIGNRAFMGCKALKIVRLRSSLEIIGDKAFGYSDVSTKLDSFKVVASKNSIGYRYALLNSFEFGQTSMLEIPYKYRIEEVADFNSDSLIKVVSLLSYCGSEESVIIPSQIDGYPVKVIDGCAFAQTNVKSVVIPDSVDRILSGAFRGCQNLESISIPESLKFIGSYAFNECNNLKELSIPKHTHVNCLAFDVA